MEKQWQICELEDDTQSFIEFSVSAVPEDWILLVDGRMLCYWPKTNAVNRIKRLESPKPDWKTYKCRILMNEDKFSTYKKAVEAEKYCQNHSTLLDVTETGNGYIQQENVCNSTMDFNVSWFLDADMSNEENAEVGHDSYMFNKAMAKGGPFYSKNATIRTDDHLNFYCNHESSDKSVADVDCSVKSDDSSQSKNSCRGSEKNVADSDSESINYSSHFKNGVGIATSTLLEVDVDPRKNDESSQDDIEAFETKISKIETKVSLFINDINKDFDELKAIARLISKKPEIEHTSTGQAVRLQSVNRKCENVFPNRVNYPFTDNNLNIGEVPRESIPAKQINGQSKHNEASNERENDSVQVAQEINENVEILDEKSEADVAMSNDSVKIAQEVFKKIEIVSNVLIGQEIAENNEIASDHLLIPIKETEADVGNRQEVIRLPVDDLDHYYINENLLEETERLETAMIEHLSPLNDEDEAVYMKRTRKLLFTDNFFIDKVTWKPEKDRALIKNSSILYCWKGGHGKIFPEDIGNKRFIAHFRRIKSAIRASIKANGKRMLNRLRK